jgi:hypothetical protein
MEVYDFAYDCIKIRDRYCITSNLINANQLTSQNLELYPINVAANDAHRYTRDFLQFLKDSIGDPVVQKINPRIIVNITDHNIEHLDAWHYKCNGKCRGVDIFIYGQVLDREGRLISWSSSPTIVAHEVSHALMNNFNILQAYTDKRIPFNEFSADIYETMALNESYADIFAILFDNRHIDDLTEWNGQLGKNKELGLDFVKLNNERFGSPKMRHLGDPSATEAAGCYHKLNRIDIYHAAPVHSLAAWRIMQGQNNGENIFHGSEDIKQLTNLFFEALRVMGGDSEDTIDRNVPRTFVDSGKAILNAIEVVFKDDDRTRQEAIRNVVLEAFKFVGIFEN